MSAGRRMIVQSDCEDTRTVSPIGEFRAFVKGKLPDPLPGVTWCDCGTGSW